MSVRMASVSAASCHTFEVVSQNVPKLLVIGKSEKYAFWVTLRLLGSMQQGTAELRTLHH